MVLSEEQVLRLRAQLGVDPAEVESEPWEGPRGSDGQGRWPHHASAPLANVPVETLHAWGWGIRKIAKHTGMSLYSVWEMFYPPDVDPEMAAHIRSLSAEGLSAGAIRRRTQCSSFVVRYVLNRHPPR